MNNLHKCKYCGGMTTGNDANCLEKPPHVKPEKKIESFDWFTYIAQILNTFQMPYYYGKTNSTSKN